MSGKSLALRRVLPCVWLALGLASWCLAESISAELGDAELEVVLSKGKITKKEPIPTGVTHPLRLWIERDGVAVSASFKDVDYVRRGRTRFASGNTELNFTDSYKYERAAYLLDRLLGLDMVPVTVVRKVYTKPGAVTLWIGDSVTGQQRIQQAMQPPDPRQFAYQQTDMRIFDALIYNTDRHAANQLHTLDDWQLHLIDHSRAFRTVSELPEEFVGRPMTISRPLLASLQSLDEQQLKRALKRMLGPTQIKAILSRRDLILEKLERDRLEFGDTVTLREEPPVP